jgi:teichuronic acid biosynthesis glycosyltransferase TuaC
MNICFVIQEIGKAPSGVVSVIHQLISEWGENDQIFILMNHKHWAFELINNNTNNNQNITVESLPFMLSSERYFKLTKSIRNKYLLLLVKILIRPWRWVEMIRVVFWLREWLEKKSIYSVMSHNGGWPGGELNRWIIWSSWLSKTPCRNLIIHNLPWSPPFLIKPFDFIRNRMIELASTKLITVSKSCASSLKNKANFKTTLNVIYNGISYTEKIRKSKSDTQEKKIVRIAFIGELHPRKGVDVLINSLRFIKNPCELILVGSGKSSGYESKLHLLAQKQQWKTRFIGLVESVEGYYPSFDVVVLPSVEFESFGMILVEAMSYSIPVVCSDFGGMKEVVKDGLNGYVVPANSSALLGGKLDYLVANPDIRVNMGVAGKNRVLKKFTASLMVKNYKKMCN